MSTKLTYQVLGNTLRMVTVRDIVMDLNVFDAITSPNNSVLHGGICFAYASGQSSPPAKPTSNTGNFCFLHFDNTRSAGSTSLSFVNFQSSSSIPTTIDLIYGVNSIVPITVGNSTFYGVDSAKLVGCACFAYNNSGSLTTAKIKVTVIKINKNSKDITTTETVIDSVARQNNSGSYSRGIEIDLTIGKSTDEVVLFVGIENIFEE